MRLLTKENTHALRIDNNTAGERQSITFKLFLVLKPVSHAQNTKDLSNDE